MASDSPVLLDRLRGAVYDHAVGFWANSVVSEEKLGEGPIEESIPGFTVLKLKSNQENRPVVYVTCGCFSVGAEGHIRHEFFLISPKADIRHVETMTMLANFHADRDYTLDVGSVVSIGAPWAEGSNCNHLLISIPYPYGPKLEWLKTDAVCIRFLWVMPITEREAAFAELRGFSALEERFDSARVNYLDISRSSVV